ncbi:MAG: hypothetical protein ACPGTO_02035 [Polaribacter sp.]
MSDKKFYTKENGKITNSDYQKLNNIGKTTVTEETEKCIIATRNTLFYRHIFLP